MKKDIQYIILLLLMSLALPAQAQEKITGYVIDDQTGDSLGFVSVQYKGQKIATVCDHRGWFSIPKHEGWKLTFSAVGYKSRTVSVGANSHHLLVALKPDTRMLAKPVQPQEQPCRRTDEEGHRPQKGLRPLKP